MAHGLPAFRLAVPGQVIPAAAVPLTRPGRWSAGPVPTPPASAAAWRPVPSHRHPTRPAAPVPSGGGSGSLPAGFTRYHDPTGFSIGSPEHWQVLPPGPPGLYPDPGGGRFLIIDQTRHPKPSPLADWRQQEAARIGSFPGYYRIRLQAVRYAQAERAADWEFTYDDNGQLTQVLNRNILANARHAYALYCSTQPANGAPATTTSGPSPPPSAPPRPAGEGDSGRDGRPSPSRGARAGAGGQRARIRLLRALCSTSASPSTSSTGGT